MNEPRLTNAADGIKAGHQARMRRQAGRPVIERPEPVEYALHEAKGFTPCTEAQMQDLERLLRDQANPALEATRHKTEAFREYFQAMRENLQEGYDCTGLNVDGNSLRSYTAFLRRHPDHDHEVHIDQAGMIHAKWDTNSAMFGKNGATCMVDMCKDGDPDLRKIKAATTHAGNVVRTTRMLTSSILNRQNQQSAGRV